MGKLIVQNSPNSDIHSEYVIEDIGNMVTADVAAIATGLTTATPANAASVTITPGTWIVEGSYIITGTGTTAFTVAKSGFNTTSATLPSTNRINVRNSGSFVPPDNIYAAACVPSLTLTVNVNTVVYLVSQSTFTISTAGVGATITARKVVK
jgi:ABC-type enterobactin transport system permease subunit